MSYRINYLLNSYDILKKNLLISWSTLHVNSSILKYNINGLRLQKLTVYYSNGMFLLLVKFLL